MEKNKAKARHRFKNQPAFRSFMILLLTKIIINNTVIGKIKNRNNCENT